MVDGGNVSREPALARAYADHRIYVEVFFGVIDRRYGNWMHFPFGGGYLDQPAYSMQILEVMRGIYLEKLAKEPSL